MKRYYLLFVLVLTVLLTGCTGNEENTSPTIDPLPAVNSTWNANAALLGVSHSDGFTVVWPDADGAVSYLVSIDGGEMIPVTGNAYTASGLLSAENGYDVAVTAVGAEDILPGALTLNCNTDADSTWESNAKMISVSHYDGFTVAWTKAANADSYLLQIGDGEKISVSENSYRATGISRISGGYEVTITIVETGGESTMKLNLNCNAKFDPEVPFMEVKELLVGRFGGNSTDDYALYRIPGMVVTRDNTLITYYEARSVSSDNGGMDIIAFRSTDSGETFSEPIMLAEGVKDNRTMNNPVMIVDKDDAKTIHFLYCVNYGICDACRNTAKTTCERHGGGVFYRKSNDDGVTWSEPVNITDSTAPESRYVIATGPDTGLCRADGTLIVPIWLVQKSNGDANNPLAQGPADVSTLYSTDGGATWQMGEILRYQPAMGAILEPIVTELSDGRVMYNIRSSGYRGYAISENGYSDWTIIKQDQDLIDPFCHAGIAAYNDGENPYTILFSNCENNTEISIAARTNMVLKGSIDDGENWNMRLVIDAGDAGYSCIAVDADGVIYVLYEVRAGEIIKLARLNYAYLRNTNAE